MLLLVRLFLLLRCGRRGLCASWMFLLISGFVLLRRLLSMLGIHALPGIRAVVVLFPTGTVVLIHVSIVSGIHVTTGGFSHRGISICRRGSISFSALRALCGGHCAVGGGIVLRVRGFVPLLNVRLAPLRGGAGALVSRAVRAGVGIVGLGYALFPVRGGSRCAARVCSCVRIVLRGARCRSVGSVSRLRVTVSPVARVIRCRPVGGGVRMIDGIAVRRISDVGRIVV